MTVERMLVKMTHAIYYLDTHYPLDADAQAARRILYRTWTHKIGRHGCKHCPAGSTGRKWAEGRGR